MKKKKIANMFLVICLLVLISILFIGCGSATPPEESTQKPAPESTPEGPFEGGILKIGTDLNPRNLGNPPTSLAQSDLLYQFAAIEALVRLDEEGVPVPHLATGWETDAEEKTITFTLREGVKFHDGTEFNAEAVQWNLERYMASERAELLQVESIEVLDDYKVRLNMYEMDNLLLPYLAFIPGLMVSPAAVQTHGEEWAETNPVGTGPFKFVSWDRDAMAKFEKYEDYWQDDLPYLDGVEIHIIVDRMTQVASLQRGEIDVIAGIDPKSAKELEAAGEYNITVTLHPGAFPHYTLDSVRPESPFSNLKVRQAFLHAIDITAIVDTIGFGYWEPLNQAALPGSWAYNPDVKGYPYNPEKAAQLLAEAGFPDGFEMSINARSISPDIEIATAFQGYLSEVGIDAKIELREPSGHIHVLMTGGFQDGILALPGTVVPNELGLLSRNFGSKVHETKHPALFVPEEVSSLADEAVVAPDFETMRKLTHQLQKAIIDDHAMIFWLYSSPGMAAKGEHVHDDGILEISPHSWTPETAWKH